MESSKEPRHRNHSDNEPLPSKAPFDYSAIHNVGDCDCASGNQATSDCTHHCHSALHERQPIVNKPPVRAPENHHFFNEHNPRPRAVNPEERGEGVEWLGEKPSAE